MPAKTFVNTVAQVCLRYPPAIGGIESYVETATRVLRQQGVAVRVETTNHGIDRSPASDEAESVTRHRLLTSGSYPLAPSLGFALLRRDVDLVHVHGQHLPSTDAALVLREAGVLKAPVVITPHYHHPRTRRGQTHQRSLGRLTARADLVLAVSQFELDALRSVGLRPRRAMVVPPAVEKPDHQVATHYTPELEHSLGWGLASRKVIAVLGRVQPHKHVDDVVRALPLVCQRCPDASLVVAGPLDQEMAESLRLLGAELGVASRMSLLGAISSGEKGALLARANVVVSASEYEAFGIGLLEALSYGTPVLGARAAAIPELLERREELLFARGDIHEMAGKVADILTSTASTRELRVWAKRRAGDFSVEAFGRGLVAGYENARVRAA